MVLTTLSDLLLIATIVVCVTDIAQFFTYFEEWLGKKIGGTVSFKILECSLCQTWWCCFIYLILTHNIHLWTLAASLFIAVQTPVIGDTIYLIRDTMGNIVNKLNEVLSK